MVVQVEWGYWTTAAVPVWTVSTTIYANLTIANNSATAQTANQGEVSPTNATITWASAQQRVLAIRCGAGAALGVGYNSAIGQAVDFSIILKRAISS